MTTTTTPAAPAGPTAPHRWPPEIDRAPALGYVGPNWFASVMGTGIVAVCAATLPFDLPGLTAVAVALWLAAAALLVVVTAATVGHWVRHPDVARGHLADPVMAHFYGAPAMALMTVGAGTLLVGHHVVGTHVAVVVDVALWTAGTALGLATAVVVPVRAFTTHDVRADSAFGGWLMPVVPPMVSAATGAALVPHLPSGQARQTMLLACYAFFGLTLVCSLVMTTFVWQRLLRHGPGAPGGVPTTWIVLGPVGQSVTAAHHLGAVAPSVLPAPYGTAFRALALVYGVPAWGFAMLWLAIAATLTVHAAREGIPFTLSWWSFTFPVGTVVTGTSGLAELTGNRVLEVVSGLLFVLLVTAWTTVAARTVHGVRTGRLLRHP